MKAFVSIVILTALPCISSAQQSPAKNSNDCPLSHWSTTGAACQWAPDLSPAVESELKSGKPIKNSYQVRGMNWLPEPLPDPLHAPHAPTPDSILKKMIRLLPDSTIRKMMPDSTIRRLRGE